MNSPWGMMPTIECRAIFFCPVAKQTPNSKAGVKLSAMEISNPNTWRSNAFQA